MLSICVPAFLRWELHHAVNVCRAQKRGETVIIHSPGHHVFPNSMTTNNFGSRMKEYEIQCTGREVRELLS